MRFILSPCMNEKMSNRLMLSPPPAVTKTRNAILRMKKCSPELRMVLRQRCQERIQNDRLQILHRFRKVKLQESFAVTFGNILKEEWKNMGEESRQEVIEGEPTDLSPNVSHSIFSLDDALILEEILEKELLTEHEDWLTQLHEELLSEDLEDSNEVVCPLCCLGYLRQIDYHGFNKTLCSKCPADFLVKKSLSDLQAAIFNCLDWHDKQCSFNSNFISIPQNESVNNLFNVCHHCSYLNVIE